MAVTVAAMVTVLCPAVSWSRHASVCVCVCGRYRGPGGGLRPESHPPHGAIRRFQCWDRVLCGLIFPGGGAFHHPGMPVGCAPTCDAGYIVALLHPMHHVPFTSTSALHVILTPSLYLFIAALRPPPTKPAQRSPTSGVMPSSVSCAPLSSVGAETNLCTCCACIGIEWNQSVDLTLVRQGILPPGAFGRIWTPTSQKLGQMEAVWECSLSPFSEPNTSTGASPGTRGMLCTGGAGGSSYRTGK